MTDDPTKQSLETIQRFLDALFAPGDWILFRPIESWTEAGCKQSRVDFKGVCHRQIGSDLLARTLPYLLSLAERKHLNLFFGVCPRFGDRCFDLAWQIRTVRALWSDVDHVTVDEVQTRLRKSDLPYPSIVVNSGNGVHLYWLLDEPYVIDDATDPPAVKTEWTQQVNGKKKPRKYLMLDGEKVYLDQQRHLERLSLKAQHIQEVVAGVAEAIGGDHTSDLARLLRLPGTLNRKDQRNGREPVPTELVECDPTKRYPLSAFEKFKSSSPESARAQQIARMPLPTPRRISPKKADQIAELIAASSIAAAGTRSEADFAVCCYAIRNSIDKEEVWRQVESVGKFAEQGRRYFDLTWENAAYGARAATFDKLHNRAQSATAPAPLTVVDDDASDSPFGSDDQDGQKGRRTIVIDPRNMPVGDTLHQITDRLLAAGNCFLRSEQLVAIHQQEITTILAAAELGGLLNEYAEFYFAEDEAGQFKPLPPAYGNTWLNQRAERNRLSTIKLFTHNPVYTEDWRLVAPGYDIGSQTYYAGPAIAAGEGTVHLDGLLKDFCFKSPADRTNYIGMLLTALLVPQFIGSKPAVLFNGNQPELGKSILAQIIAILRDGQPAETASFNSNDEEFEKRLGAIVRRGATTIIIDNAKAHGRNPRIESACLERSITDPILSFRLLGQSASIRAENSHIFCITANAPDVSRDLVTRSVVINLFHEGNPEQRQFSIADIEGYAQEHRLEMLGELIGMVERWKASGMPMGKVHSRFNKRNWGNIVGGILEACGEPDFLANAEEAATMLDETRREFAELVNVLAGHPQGTWSPSELVDLARRHGLLAADLGDGSPRSLSTKIGNLAGRFVKERFQLPNGRIAVFHKKPDRNGTRYRVAIEELRNLGPVAEPMRNLETAAGSAP